MILNIVDQRKPQKMSFRILIRRFSIKLDYIIFRIENIPRHYYKIKF